MQPDHVADAESARCESACNAVDLCDQRSVCGDCARTALDECRLVEVCGVGISEQEVVDAEVGDFNVGEGNLEAHYAPRKVSVRGGVTNLLCIPGTALVRGEKLGMASCGERECR